MASMSTSLGLRERKKQRTRELITETAWALFADRGFDAVTVTDVAAAAEVSPATVFNYFQTKEDLVYGRLEAFEDELLAAIRDRPAGESILTAFSRFVLRPRGLLAEPDPESAARLVTISRVISESPALLARERQIYARYTNSLAEVIAGETGAGPGDAEPWVVANALIGVHRALVDSVRRRVLAGRRSPRLAREVRAEGERALALLECGLGAYGVKV
jgi:AcrR family transcriptional regulator